MTDDEMRAEWQKTQDLFKELALGREKKKPGIVRRTASAGWTLGGILGIFVLVALMVGIALLPYIVIAHFVVKYW